MRIRSLYLSSFKNLQDFSMPSPADSGVVARLEGNDPLLMMLGRNGSGKSNLLEALLTIFRDLDLNQSTSFGYRLTYECNGQLVSIDSTGTSRPTVSLQPIDGAAPMVKTLTWGRFCGPEGAAYRPANVFGYYSGQSQRFADLFSEHEKRFRDELLRSESPPLRRLFLAKPGHSQFVLLAFFSDADGFRTGPKYRFLREELRIESLESVLFILHDPSWRSAAERAMRSHPEEDRDARFWGARGTVKAFLRSLFNRSLAPLRLKAPAGSGHREHLHLYLSGEEALRGLREDVGASTAAEFFAMLESTEISDLLAEVRIRVRIKGSDGALTFRELSEGEQQLLTVLGLIEFTRTSEALFLLDEPDTHLNPAWSMNYSRLLIDQMDQDTESSQVIVATHDPVAIADLTRTSVLLLEREVHVVRDQGHWRLERTGQIVARHPDIDPRGMGVSGVLTSELFGLKTTIDPSTMEKIDRRLELSSRGPTLTEHERDELSSLIAELEGLGFNYEFVDPYQQAFAQRLSQEYAKFRADLTAGERDLLQAETDALFEEILEEDSDSESADGRG